MACFKSAIPSAVVSRQDGVIEDQLAAAMLIGVAINLLQRYLLGHPPMGFAMISFREKAFAIRESGASCDAPLLLK